MRTLSLVLCLALIPLAVGATIIRRIRDVSGGEGYHYPQPKIPFEFDDFHQNEYKPIEHNIQPTFEHQFAEQEQPHLETHTRNSVESVQLPEPTTTNIPEAVPTVNTEITSDRPPMVIVFKDDDEPYGPGVGTAYGGLDVRSSRLVVDEAPKYFFFY